MSSLTYEQVAQLAYDVGLRGEALAVAVAVSKGESGHRTDAVGDRTITDGTWGPSIGLWQIRSVKKETNTGGTRDGTRLLDPTYNARSMAAVSGGGKNWRPWTIYTKGAYLAYMPAARAAAAKVEAGQRFPIGEWSTSAEARAAVVEGLRIPSDSRIDIGGFPGSGLVENAAGAVAGVVETVTDPIVAVGEFLGKLANPGLWRRLGVGVLGVALVLVGLVLLFRLGALSSAAAAIPSPATEGSSDG